MKKITAKLIFTKFLIAAVCLISLSAIIPVFAAGGDVDTTFNAGAARFNNSVSDIALQPDGRILIGGNFTVVNGRVFNRLARLNADGTIDESFNVGAGFNNTVNTVAVQTDGRILVGGTFSAYNGAAVSRLIRLNADGSPDTTFNSGGSGFSGEVNAVFLQPDGRILVGGNFTTYNGATANRIIRLNSDGATDASFNIGTGFNTIVNSIARQPNGQILAGGNFTAYNGATVNRVARLNSDGSLDTAFATNTGTGANNQISAIALQSDGRILIGGLLTNFNGTTVRRIARLNVNGTLDATFSAPPNGLTGIQDIAVQIDDRIIIGGNFIIGTGANQRVNLARLDADGSHDATFLDGIGAQGGEVGTIALQFDGSVYAGGAFETFNGLSRSALARVAANGMFDAAFGTVIGSPASVEAMAIETDGRILIGGDFLGVNEAFRSRIARLNADGSIDTGFDPGAGANNIVYSIALQADGRILIGGSFTSFDGQTANRLARLNADGSLDTSFSASFNGTVEAVAVQTDGRILVGGAFSSVNGVSGTNRIVRLNSNGTTDAAFNAGTGFNNIVQTLAIQANGQIIVGGFFTAYNGAAANRIARLNADGSLDTAFTTNTGTGFNNPVYIAVLQPDGGILVGGSFSSLNGMSQSGLARLNSNGTPDGGFNVGTGVAGTVFDLALQSDGRVIIGGAFNSYAGVARNRLARVNADGSLDASFDPGSGADNQVFAVELQADGRIIIGGVFDSYNNQNRLGIARILAGDTVIWTGAADSNWNNPANWSGNLVPAAADNAVVPAGALPNLPVVSGNFSVTSLTVGAGNSLTIGAGGSLTTEGLLNDGMIGGAGTLDLTGNAFTNNGAISVANVVIAGSGAKTLIGTGSFADNLLTIGSAVTLSLQSDHQFNEINLQGVLSITSRTIFLSGANPLQGSGFLNTNFSTVVFNGSAPQSVSRVFNFNDLTIDNASGVIFTANQNVNGTLDLADGTLTMSGTAVMILSDLADISRTNGYVVGLIRKNFDGAGAFTFPVGTANGYSPLDVNITAINGASGLTVRAVQNTHPNAPNPPVALSRYWTITETGDLSAVLTFHYLQSDVPGGIDESDLQLRRYTGTGTLFDIIPATLDTAANTATTTGSVTDFSDWTLFAMPLTAANVSVGGRALTADGRGIPRARITLIDSSGNSRAALTNSFGYYRFSEVTAGEIYFISIRHKVYQFSPDTFIINPAEDLTEVNFTANRGEKNNAKIYH